MAFRATFLAVVGVTLAGHLVALGFEIAAAARFGTGREADALAFALTLFITMTAEVVGWVSTLFVPLYIETRAASAARAAGLARRVLVALAAVTGAAALLLALAAPVVVAALAPALGARGVAVLRAFAPLLVVLPLAALFAATLQAHGRFVAASLRQLSWYGGGLAGLLVLAGALGAVAAPLGMLVGALAFAAALAVATRRVVRLREAEGGGPSLGRIAALLTPLALLSGAAIVNVAVERALAARLPEGSLAALTYAYRLLHFPLALFVVNATTMLLPRLAGHAVRGEAGAVEALTGRALRIAVVFAVPLAALAWALAEPATHLLLERGAFTAASTAATATAITWYAPGVVALALAQILFRAYQAVHALWRLAAAVGAGIGVNLVLMPALTALLGFRGLPLASSLSAFVLVAFMLLGLRGRVRGAADALATRSTIAVLVAGAAGGAAAWLARGVGGGAAVPGLVAGLLAGAGVYVAALAALAPAEARVALAIVVPAASGRSA
jgi:putative peptidoglycan lipid II flippase